MAETINPNYNSKYFPPHVNSIEELQEFVNSTSVDKPLGNFDAIPYLCSLVRRSDSDDDVIYSGDGFDYDNHLQSYYKQLTAIGDGRVNFYEVWKYIEKNIIPRAKAQTEVLQTGGCTIIDDYLCDTITGQKIKQFKNTCNVALSEPITFDEISSTVNTIMKVKRELHADSFIKYLKTNYIDKGWSVKLVYYSSIFIFYVELTKKELKDGSKTEYNTFYEVIKYYSDVKDYISEKLKIDLTVIDSMFIDFSSSPDSLEIGKKVISNFSNGKIPDYSNGEIPEYYDGILSEYKI
jgi:hypothetical protein